MKKPTGPSIDTIRQKIDEMVGRNISMTVCRGRKQYKHYDGIVQSAFPRVFVVRLSKKEGAIDSLSYSYNDILCGEVVINETTA
ncbi:MAG: Veg family protein [Firmicutes bacterium]|nr:Veg family protein [Bacillota bacterium]